MERTRCSSAKIRESPASVEKPDPVSRTGPAINLKLDFRLQVRCYLWDQSAEFAVALPVDPYVLLKPSRRQFVQQLEEGYEIALTCSVGADHDIERAEFQGRILDGSKALDLDLLKSRHSALSSPDLKPSIGAPD